MAEIEIEDQNVIIPEDYDYESFNTLEVVEADVLTYNNFFYKFMLKNIPCIVRNISKNWECDHKWIKDDQIDYDYFVKTYGHLEAPVSDCSSAAYFNSNSKDKMKVCEFFDYLKNKIEGKLIYLKDWHLKRLLPDDKFYEVPLIFGSDWLNEFSQDNNEDDHMFVYIGPKDTWTPLHVDVYFSFSWSVNVFGTKKWILLPPGEEKKICDKLGNLPLQFDKEEYSDVKYFEIIQKERDAIFVPSGWHHVVYNLVDTISVNHNWINGCNIHQVWGAIQRGQISVEQEIAQLKHSEDFPLLCQKILKSEFGMDYTMFSKFIGYIGKKRLNQLKSGDTKAFGNYVLGIKHIKFDLIIIIDMMEKMSNHPIFMNKNLIAIEIQNELLTTKNAIKQYLKI